VICWELPVKTVSEANIKEHWSKSSKRHKLQQKHVRFKFLEDKPEIDLPVQIMLTRIGKRKLDDDNLRISFKWIKDQIAACLFPGSRLGQADDDPRLIWHYAQEIGKPGIKISFLPINPFPS